MKRDVDQVMLELLADIVRKAIVLKELPGYAEPRRIGGVYSVYCRAGQWYTCCWLAESLQKLYPREIVVLTLQETRKRFQFF